MAVRRVLITAPRRDSRPGGVASPTSPASPRWESRNAHLMRHRRPLWRPAPGSGRANSRKPDHGERGVAGTDRNRTVPRTNSERIRAEEKLVERHSAAAGRHAEGDRARDLRAVGRRRRIHHRTGHSGRWGRKHRRMTHNCLDDRDRCRVRRTGTAADLR